VLQQALLFAHVSVDPGIPRSLSFQRDSDSQSRFEVAAAPFFAEDVRPSPSLLRNWLAAAFLLIF